jgi:hypothetical protein
MWLIDGLWIQWFDLFTPYTSTTQDYRQLQPSDLHTLQFTVTYTLGFSVFTSRILATDFITICHYKSHMKSSFHKLIPFLPSFCNCQLNSTPKLISWQAVSKFVSVPLNWTLLYNHFVRTTQKTRTLCCWEGVVTALLHSNGSCSIVACIFVSAEMCLPSHCPAMNVNFDFTTPACGSHYTT